MTEVIIRMPVTKIIFLHCEKLAELKKDILIRLYTYQRKLLFFQKVRHNKSMWGTRCLWKYYPKESYHKYPSTCKNQ